MRFDVDDTGYSFPETMSQVLTWRLCAELARRYPDQIWVQPADYDFYHPLWVIDLHRPRGDMVVAAFNNVGGSIRFPTNPTENLWHWPTAYRDDDLGRDEWLTALARACRLPDRHGPLPPAAPQTLAIRYTAAFLALQIGARHDWFADPLSFCKIDLSSYTAFTDWHTNRPERGTDDDLIVLHTRQPDFDRPLILTRNGRLWLPNNHSHQLSQLHRSGQPVTALIARTAATYLP